MGESMNILGGFTKASGQIAQGKAAQKAEEFNALMTEAQGKQQESLIRRRGEQTISRAKALIGKSGVTLEGSPLEAIAESAAQTEMDILNTRFTTRTSAFLSRERGKQARKQAGFAAASTFFDTLGNVGKSSGGPQLPMPGGVPGA